MTHVDCICSLSSICSAIENSTRPSRFSKLKACSKNLRQSNILVMVCLFSDPNMETLLEGRFCDVVSKDQNIDFSTGNVATLEANHLQDTGTFSLTSTDWGLKDGFGLYRSRFSSYGGSSSFFRESFSFGSQELWNRFSHKLKDSFSQRFENSLRVAALAAGVTVLVGTNKFLAIVVGAWLDSASIARPQEPFSNWRC